MTLDEAIKNCEEVAEEKRKDYERACAYNIPSEGCFKCAEEHRQLAEWLKELKRLKEQGPILDKIRAELHSTAEMHEDGDYYLRDEWIDEYFDKYKAESEVLEWSRTIERRL